MVCTDRHGRHQHRTRCANVRPVQSLCKVLLASLRVDVVRIEIGKNGCDEMGEVGEAERQAGNVRVYAIRESISSL